MFVSLHLCRSFQLLYGRNNSDTVRINLNFIFNMSLKCGVSAKRDITNYNFKMKYKNPRKFKVEYLF